jgi:hypothetical protein
MMAERTSTHISALTTVKHGYAVADFLSSQIARPGVRWCEG